MQRPVRIEFVSDIVCPWCAIALHSLLAALKRVQDSAMADISFQPFELDPAMPKGGEDSTAYVARKYGLSPTEAARNRQIIRTRAAEVGFDMAAIDSRRLYNTFDAHRLVHWAEIEKRQVDLELALLEHKYVISGSRTPSEYEEALRHVVAQQAG